MQSEINLSSYYDQNNDHSESCPNSMLRKGCTNNNIDLVRQSLDNGADIHHCEDRALSIAINCKYEDLIKFLIHSGANLERAADASILYAIGLNDTSIIDYLQEMGINITDQHLNMAIRMCKIEFVKLFLRLNPNFNVTNAFQSACKENATEIAIYLLQFEIDIANCVPASFNTVAANGNLSLLKLLIQYNFPLDPRIITDACLSNNINCIKILLENNFSISNVVLAFIIDFISMDTLRFLVSEEVVINIITLWYCIISNNFEKFMYIHDSREWDPKDILNLIDNCASRESPDKKITDFLLKNYSHLFDDDTKFKLYQKCLIGYSTIFLEYLLQYSPLENTMAEKLKLCITKYYLARPVIEFMQSKGYWII